MSHVQVHAPEFSYDARHEVERRRYRFADDLFNEKYWKDSLTPWNQKINDYLTRRNISGAFHPATGDIREIHLTGSVSGTPTPQTIAGELVENHVLISLGKLIKGQYEHYQVNPLNPNPAGTPFGPPTRKGFVLKDVDDVVKKTAELATGIASLQHQLGDATSLQHAISPGPNQRGYHEQYVEEKRINDPTVLVATNPELSKYQLYPEVLALDAFKNSGGGVSDSQYPQEFVMGSMLGWRHVGLEDRTFGAPSDLGAIIGDIMLMNLQTWGTGVTEFKSGGDPDNFKYVYALNYNKYENLMSSNLVDLLEKHNEDFVSAPTMRNPFVVGVRNSYARYPELYFLWSAYRAARTPFYNRVHASGQRTTAGATQLNAADIIKFLNIAVQYTPGGGGGFAAAAGTYKIVPTPPTYAAAEVKNVTDALFGIPLEGKKANPQDLGLVGEAMLLPGQVGGQEEVAPLHVDKDLVMRIITKIHNLGPNQRAKLFVNSCSYALYTLYHLGHVPWETLNTRLPSQADLAGGMDATQYVGVIPGAPAGAPVIGPALLDPATRVIKSDMDLNTQLRNAYRSSLGTSQGNPMGGTAFDWSTEITAQRMDREVTYPGDSSVMQNLQDYLSLLQTDLGGIEQSLRLAERRMANKFWYRDVLRWLEVLYEVLRPLVTGVAVGPPVFHVGTAHPANPMNDKIRQQNFANLKKVVQLLYSKQLAVMREYVSKMNALSRQITRTTSKQNTVEIKSAEGVARQQELQTLFSSTVICYLKRQIYIIFDLLNRAQGTAGWGQPTAAGAPAAYPTMNAKIRKLKIDTSSDFRQQATALMAGQTDPSVIKFYQNVQKDLCATGRGLPDVGAVSATYLADRTRNRAIADERFWKLLFINLKGWDQDKLNEKTSAFRGLYVPIQHGSNYTLFDLAPLVFKGDFKLAGLRSGNNWISANRLGNADVAPPTQPADYAKFGRNNQATVVVANTSTQLSTVNDWRAIDEKWVSNLLSKAALASTRTGVSQRKLWVIRLAIFIMLNDGQIYTKNNVSTGFSASPLRNALVRIQGYTDGQKQSIAQFMDVTGRDVVSQYLITSLTQLQTIASFS